MSKTNKDALGDDSTAPVTAQGNTTAPAPAATSAAVYADNGGLIRTYTLDVHGDGFADLAKEFSGHTPGSTIVLS